MYSTKMAPLSKPKSKAASKGSKADHSSNKSAVKPSGPRVNFTHEGHHDDDEVILPETFPFAEVIPSWGPNFNPNVMNAALGKQFSKGHHATKGGTGKKRKDFENFTLACCLEWIRNSEGNWCRCANTFTVDSDQCTTHRKVTHKDGPNQIYRHMKEGREGNWGMLKNRHLQPEEVPLTQAQVQQRRADEMEAEISKRCSDGQDYGAAFFAVEAEFREQDALARKIEKQEARSRSATSNAVEESTGNNDPGRPKSHPLSGIAALEKKAQRNPNQRGKTIAKGATKLKKLATIPE
jgi:hypothetical protein